MTRIDILLTPDLYNGHFTVTVPALPGIVTVGRTVDEALANAQDTIECHTDRLNSGELARSGARFDLVALSVPVSVDVPE